MNDLEKRYLHNWDNILISVDVYFLVSGTLNSDLGLFSYFFKCEKQTESYVIIEPLVFL